METAWKNDLPQRLDPMTAKELRQGMRRGSFVTLFLTIQFLAVVSMVAEFQTGHDTTGADDVGMLNLWLLLSSGPFWMVVALVCMILMPMSGVVLMGQELEEGNHELLLLTKLSRWRVVIGKFVTLWGLSVVTFVSLLPYVVVRYLIGGIEWWHEAACAATVLGGSAMIGAGAIGASAFLGIGARVSVFVLFLVSLFFGCGVPLFVVALRTGGCGWVYHLTAVSAVLCYTLIGLCLARSRLRLSVMAYEVKPGGMIIGWLVFAPFVIGTITALTLGYGGLGGLLLVGLISTRLDMTPRCAPPSAEGL